MPSEYEQLREEISGRVRAVISDPSDLTEPVGQSAGGTPMDPRRNLQVFDLTLNGGSLHSGIGIVQ